MRLKKLDIQGFRCFGPDSTTWNLGADSWVVVGPTNAGKSTLATALDWALGRQPTVQDFFGMVHPAKIRIMASLELDSDESDRLASGIFDRQRVLAFSDAHRFWPWLAQTLFSSISFEFEADLNDEHANIILERRITTPILQADPDTNKIVFATPAGGGGDTDVQQFLQATDEFFQANPSMSSGELLTYLQSSGIRTVVTRQKLHADAISLISSQLKLLTEVRARPNLRQDDSLETWDGQELAGVLGAMSSGDIQQKDGYRKIEKISNTLHYPLKLHPHRTQNKWEIGFQSPAVDSLISSDGVGMGTLQNLLLVTNLVSSKNRVIVLEEPELHLHPPAQRALGEVFRTARTENQVILLTHSPQIMNAASGYRILRLPGGPEPPELLPTDPGLLQSIHPVWVRDYVREALFARYALLVEGPYDLLTFQNLLDIVGSNWRSLGIVVVPVDGKKGILRPHRFLEASGIDVFVCVDDDALSRTEDSWKEDGNEFPIAVTLRHALEVGKIESNSIPELRAEGNSVGPQAGYGKSFINKWRKVLWKADWFVLTDKLDYLLLKAVGDKVKGKKGSSDNKRRAEEIARNISYEDIPDELKLIAQIIKERVGVSSSDDQS